jgi:dihydrodipicolinate synthase/N-acetylneuraminate lyase
MTGFEGVYTAPITPMTADHELNEDALRTLVEFNIQAGIDGFWAAGGGGESILLDDDENGRIAQIVKDQCAGRAKTIMHVGAPTTKRAARMAEFAAGVGVEAICCVPPFFYRQTDDAVVEHYRVVAAAADLPFFAYNLPQMTNCEITPSLMAKIQDAVPQLTGLKHSAVDFGHVRPFVKMGLACFIGRAPWMLPALSMGAVGCVDGWQGIAPEFWVECLNAFRAGDMDRALAAQDKGIEVVKLFGMGPMHGVLKAANSIRLGIDCGTPRPPGSPLTPEQHKAVCDHMAKLDLPPVEAMAAQ